MRFALIATTLAAAAVATPVPGEQTTEIPKPGEVTVECECPPAVSGKVQNVTDVVPAVSWAGSGCPAGSVAYDLGEDNQVVALSFDSFVAGTGKGMKATDKRKNCNIRMKLNFPLGWTYTVARTDVRGYVQLPETCTATLSTTSYFSGHPGEVREDGILFK